MRGAQKRFSRLRSICRATIEIEEWPLAAVNELLAVRRPFGPEVTASVSGDARPAGAADLEDPDIARRIRGPDIDRHAPSVRGEAGVVVAIAPGERWRLVPLAIDQHHLGVGDIGVNRKIRERS